MGSSSKKKYDLNMEEITDASYRTSYRFLMIFCMMAIVMLIITHQLVMVVAQNKAMLVLRSLESNVENCNIRLVESIPVGLVYPENSPKFMSTFEAWSTLLNLANASIDFGSFYWTLRGVDVVNHTTAREGEEIFNKILSNSDAQRLKIRIAQSVPTANNPNVDTEIFAKQKAAEVRSLNFPKLVGGGVLHTKVIIVDNKHFYLGSANMDWRSLTQVKELGVLAQNCTALAADVAKIFEIYWYLGGNDAKVPKIWPTEYTTIYNSQNPMTVNFNANYNKSVYFSSSPPPLSAKGRENDIDSILNTINTAKHFVYIAVMDYLPLMMYEPKIKYWPMIDDALRAAAIDRKIAIKMLISWWPHSRPSEDYFLRSLATLTNSSYGVDIEIKRFIVPSNADQKQIPFGRVNHNKYMVTDNTAYIGTSNWSGDYFVNTAGIGLIIRDKQGQKGSTNNDTTLRDELQQVFERDWKSEYAHDFK